MAAWRQRSVSALICLGLGVLAFVQSPGLVTVDTKLDLTENPLGWFARAAHLWNDQAGFGQVENQAYGYFFPMGPFFLAGHELGVPAWVVQRLWTALVLIVAYLGMRRLARALGIGDEASRHVAGLAWALAPRIITTIGPISFESLSMALLPWCLLPLVSAGRTARGGAAGSRGDTPPWRPAAVSALVVFAMGGANGSVVLAVLVAPLLWLLAGARDRWGRRLLAWWLGFVTLAIAWWLIPLLATSRYVAPFLERSEPAWVTSSRVSVWQALRGADHWVGGIFTHAEPWWPAAWYVYGNQLGIVATAAVALLGFAGLLRRDLPRRPFWLALAGLGLLALTIGYAGRYGAWYDAPGRQLLDGPLAAFRNVHKFDPLLRLPIVLGLAHLLTVARAALVRATLAGYRRLRSRGLSAGSGLGVARGLAQGTALVGLAAVLVAAGPAFTGALRTGPGFPAIPGYWREAATWLATQAHGTAYLAPGAGFGEYTWGRAYDDPLQPLAKAPWAVRTQVPMGQAGGVRWMDEVERVLASGQGSPALGEFLARAGVSHLVVRNDLEWWRTGTARPAVVHQSLARSTGVHRVASFGPESGRAPRDPVELLGYDVDPGYPAVEIFAVTPSQGLVSLVDAASVAAVTGGPESLLPLLEDGLVGVGTPVVLAGDGQGPPATRWLSTDGLQRREVNIGRVHDAQSATMTATEPYRLVRPVQPYELFPAGHQTVAGYDAATAILASSSEGYADSFGPTREEHQPYAAFDGDPDTYWKSSVFGSPVGEWLEIQLDRPAPVDHVTVHLAADPLIGHAVRQVVVTTDAGTSVHTLTDPGQPQQLPTRAGRTGRVRLTVVAMVDPGYAQVAVRELTVPGVAVRRTLRLPDDPPASLPDDVLDGVSLRQDPPRYACVDVAGGVRCDPALAAGVDSTALDRVLTVRAPARFTVEAAALPRPGAGLAALVAPTAGALSVVGSSTFSGDPAVAASNAVDGDPATAWVTEGFDEHPTLRYRWRGRTRIDKLELEVAGYPAAAAPREAVLVSPAGTRRLTLRGSGTYPFPALVTDQVSVELGAVSGVASTDPVTGVRSPLPVGVAELTFPALAGRAGTRSEADPLDLRCGSGPALSVDGRSVPTRVAGTVGDLVHHRPVTVVPCAGPIQLRPGEHRVQVLPTAALVPVAATLRRTDGPTPASADRSGAVQVRSWGPADRMVEVRPGSRSILVVRQNFSTGWEATLDGQRLRPVRMDGWLQGWVVPEGLGGEVRMTFRPDRAYRIGLLAGGVGVLVLVLLNLGHLLAALRARRRRPGPLATQPRPLGGRHEAPRRADYPADAPWLRWVLPVAVLLIGGLAGAVAVAAAAVTVLLGTLLLRVLRPLRPTMSVALPALGCLLAAGILAVTVDGPTGDRVQLLSVIAVAGLAVGGVAEPRVRRRPLALPQQRPDEPVLDRAPAPAAVPARRALTDVASTRPALTSAVPAGTAPASAAPASTIPASATPASAIPASAIPASATPASATPAGATPAGGELHQGGGEDGRSGDEQRPADHAADRRGPGEDDHDLAGRGPGRDHPAAPVPASEAGGEEDRDEREPAAEGGEPPGLRAVADERPAAEHPHHQVAEERRTEREDQPGAADQGGAGEHGPQPPGTGADAREDDNGYGLRQPERNLRHQ
ncbi:MAG TPA: alpha-(1-_3)-arabinofuranosyltransferase family protein [Micromonosporaceae bacterium]|nr:alpha-(1->3)-arabinofuranosyltransferase family protein [Micromonosporaceae bacterium]